METNDITTQITQINWKVILPYLLATFAPTVIGFLQQWSKTTVEKLPWYAKSIFTAAIGALITMITNYATQGDGSIVAGAVLASVGSVNIALRKGTRTNLERLRQERVDEAVKKFSSC